MLSTRVEIRMRGLCSVRARRATSAALLAETFRRARVRDRFRLLWRGRGRLFDRIARILQAALERLNALADRRPDFRDALGAEHQGDDGHQNQDVPDTEVCEHAQNIAASARRRCATVAFGNRSIRTIGRSNPETTTVASKGPEGRRTCTRTVSPSRKA